MKKNDLELLALAAVSGLAAWLWLTRSGRAAAESTGSAVATAAERVTAIAGAITRGERNNNPGNIRHSATAWRGQAPDQTQDAEFVTFLDPVSGIRALARTLKTYYDVHGLDSITALITRWAPPSENDTASYINAVAQYTGIDAFASLNVNDPLVLTPLVSAIIQQENGRVAYAPDIINQGVNLA